MGAKKPSMVRAVLPAPLVVPLLLCAAEVEAASFRILGTSSLGWESHYTTVSGVSVDGTTAVGSYSHHPEVGQPHRYARLWNAGEVELDGIEGAALSVSDNGSVVVGQWDRWTPFGGSSVEAFRWTWQTGAIGLGYLDGGGGYSSASGVSADGSVVVGRSDSAVGNRAFRWTPSGGMVSLGTLPGHNTSGASSVSADGSVVVGSSNSDSAAEAFRWTAGGMVGLGRVADDIDSYAYDVSADGSVVVGWSGTGIHSEPYPVSGVPGDEAFLWTEVDGMVGLGYLPGHGWSQAYAVSADGSIVVGASAPVEDHGEYRSVGTHEPFIWDGAHGMRSLTDLLLDEYGLELPDWPLGHPSDISSDGTVIVGNGGGIPVVRGGAWMVVIPEPSTIALAVIGLLGLLAYAWRRRRRPSRALQCRPRPLAAWSVLLVVPLLVCAAEVEAASFRILGTSRFNLEESEYTTVNGVSADGTTAVGSYTHQIHVGTHEILVVKEHTYPLRWSADGVEIGNGEGSALSVSADGSVVVGHKDPSILSPHPAFRWTPQTGMIELGYLDGGGYSRASGVSADGSVIVGLGNSTVGNRAFRWTRSAGMIDLGTLPGHESSWAESVSGDGSVIVGSSKSDSTAEAFRWTATSGMVGLGRLGEHRDSYAQDVSADGSAIVGYCGTGPDISYPLDGVPGTEAFLWTKARGMIGLGYLPGHAWSQAYAISADGSTVVGASAPVEEVGDRRYVGAHEPFIWDAAHGMRSLTDLLLNEYGLDLPDWRLGHPSDISSDGTVIVGNGGGLPVTGGAWMVVIPEPSTIALALIALLGLLAYTWRKRRCAA